MLSKEQHDALLKPVQSSKVKRNPQGRSYLPAWHVTAQLNKIFGFEGWDKEILDLWLIAETETENGNRWTVTYGCRLRLLVYSRGPTADFLGHVREKSTDDAGTGTAINQPSRGDAHDQAIKSAVSDALKRCAKDMGDQFGLSLYDDGSTDPVVVRVLPYQEEANEPKKA